MRSLTYAGPARRRRNRSGNSFYGRQEVPCPERSLPGRIVLPSPENSSFSTGPFQTSTQDSDHADNTGRDHIRSGTSGRNASIGASIGELREAWGWLNGDEALMGEGRPLPGTRVAKLIDVLDTYDED